MYAPLPRQIDRKQKVVAAQFLSKESANVFFNDDEIEKLRNGFKLIWDFMMHMDK